VTFSAVKTHSILALDVDVPFCTFVKLFGAETALNTHLHTV